MVNYIIDIVLKFLRLMRIGSGLTYDFFVAWAFIYIYLIHKIFDYRVISCVLALMLSIRLAFLVNNIADIREDTKHRDGSQKNPLVTDESLLKLAKASAILLPLVGLSLVTLLQDYVVIVLYVILISLGITYSLPPRWKTFPPFDLISHGFFFGALLPYIVFRAMKIPVTPPLLLALLGIFFFSTSCELSNHIRDYKYDLVAGLNTTAIWLGYRKSIILNQLLLIISLLLLSLAILLLQYALYPLILVQFTIGLLIIAKKRDLVIKNSSPLFILLLIEFLYFSLI